MKLLQKLFILIFAFLSIGISAQVKDPVKFQLKINELKNNEYEAVLTAHLEKNWHIYSKDIPEDSGIPTEMKVSGKNIELIGKVTEVGKKEDEFSEAFGVRIVYYSNSVAFKQKFKLKNPAQPSNVIAEITYQTCDDRVCLAPNTLEFEQSIASKNSEFAEIPSQEAIKEESTAVSKSTNETKSIENSIKVESLDAKNPLTNCGISAQKENSDNFWIFDKDKLRFPLKIRRKQDGDFFYPKGFNGKKKISKFFKDEKISIFAKSKIWLLCDAENRVMGILPMRQDRRFLPDEETKNTIKIKLK